MGSHDAVAEEPIGRLASGAADGSSLCRDLVIRDLEAGLALITSEDHGRDPLG